MKTWRSPIQRFLHSLKDTFHRAWQAAHVGPAGMRGAAVFLLSLAALIYLIFVANGSIGPFSVFVPVLVIFLLLGALLGFLGQGIAKFIGLLNAIPWQVRWMLFGALALLFVATGNYPFLAKLLLILPVTLLGLLVGAGAGPLLQPSLGWSPAQRGFAIGLLSTGLLGLAAGLGWYLWPGSHAPVLPDAADIAAPPEKISLPDPGKPGPYLVETLTYGAGTDRFRAEFGSQADIITGTVDGSLLLNSSWKGFNGTLRTLEWGYTPKTLPINGRVWYPAAGGSTRGPFPLVLIVHGNHTDMDFSDTGYAYLGELLASRGFIFVSVDENFLNSGQSNFPGSMGNENDARAWLLLEHLRAWQAWNQTEGNPFYGLVDTDKITLIGHSRGGEAVSVAALFNRLPYYPDNSSLVFDYHYNIRGVIAIAPIDSFYRPAGQSSVLEDVSYLVLHGSHDGDASSFNGLRQFERIHYTGGAGFKAALYFYRGNHGQFNTTWGDWDIGGWRGLLNRAALLSGAEQRQVAKVYISAFLETVLHGENGYLPLFADSRAGAGWLPETIYLNRYEQAGDRVLANYTEDVDLTTATLRGALISAQDFTTWREQLLPTKWGGTETSAVLLAWDESKVPAYAITLPADLPEPSPGAALIFALADAKQDPAHAKGFEQPAVKGPRQPVDLSVVLRDAKGSEAGLPLSRYRMVQPQLEAQLWKLKALERYPRSEPVLQSFVFPLSDFAAANPALDIKNLAEVRFVFDRTSRGSLFLSAVGFRGW